MRGGQEGKEGKQQGRRAPDNDNKKIAERVGGKGGKKYQSKNVTKNGAKG